MKRQPRPSRGTWEHGVRARLNRHILAAAGPAPCAPVKAAAPMLDKLSLVRPLGAGGFGRVQLMRHAPTRRVYALKVINKLTLLNSKSAYARCGWVMREREMLGQVDHPFIVQVLRTRGLGVRVLTPNPEPLAPNLEPRTPDPKPRTPSPTPDHHPFTLQLICTYP